MPPWACPTALDWNLTGFKSSIFFSVCDKSSIDNLYGGYAALIARLLIPPGAGLASRVPKLEELS